LWLLRDILEDKVFGKPARVRKRLNILNDLAKKGKYTELKRRAKDSHGWQELKRAGSHACFSSEYLEREIIDVKPSCLPATMSKHTR